MNKIEQHKKALLEALESSLGVVTSACKKVGVGRTTFYNYVNSDEEFAKAVQDIENVALDFAESQLHQQIKTGNATSTIFYLKTKGKKRGYVERMENVNTNKNLDLSNLTDEELQERLKQAKRVTDG
jgi:predicted DNA-binding transcriptional regulator AlpA